MIYYQLPFAHKNPGPEVFHVEDIQVPVTTPAGEITVRVYSPKGPGPFPVHLNFHGGKCSTCSTRWSRNEA